MSPASTGIGNSDFNALLAKSGRAQTNVNIGPSFCNTSNRSIKFMRGLTHVGRCSGSVMISRSSSQSMSMSCRVIKKPRMEDVSVGSSGLAR